MTDTTQRSSETPRTRKTRHNKRVEASVNSCASLQGGCPPPHPFVIQKKQIMAFFDFITAIIDSLTFIFDRQYRKTVLITLAIIILTVGFVLFIYYLIT